MILGVVEVIVSFIWLAIAVSHPADAPGMTAGELADIRGESATEMTETKPRAESSSRKMINFNFFCFIC